MTDCLKPPLKNFIKNHRINSPQKLGEGVSLWRLIKFLIENPCVTEAEKHIQVNEFVSLLKQRMPRLSRMLSFVFDMLTVFVQTIGEPISFFSLWYAFGRNRRPSDRLTSSIKKQILSASCC